ncbi:MAG TPA: DUF1848 domain-containing protein [Alphaproteobacteria bacterium]|nr:DUF1848 domain-containing protein [Alphaproteobacteria bacterium]
MIVSASYRTDIPAFYAEWFARRLAEGFALVGNPYGGAEYRVDLRPGAVAGWVFWTKNLGPFRPQLEAVRARGEPFVVQYSITGLPTALEKAVPRPEAAVGHMRELARRFGPRAAVWRYDPVVLTDLTPPAWHRETFARLAGGLRGATDEVTVSFLQLYRKTGRNLRLAAERHGLSWRLPEPEEQRALLDDLTAIAADHGMALTLCTQPGLGGVPARCIDAARLSDVAGRPLPARTKGNRPGCLCAESHDIGAYDGCPHGCVYCYAVSDHARAQARLKAHDPAAPKL